MPFEIEAYIIVSNAFGKLDLLLADTMEALREIKYGTKDLNRYRFIEVFIGEEE